MKKYLLVAVAVLFAASAFAADKPVKKPIYIKAPPAPINLWTGFYAGGNVGYSWGIAHTDLAGNGTIISGPPLFQNPPVAFADSQTQRLTGLIGGGQAGYNYQIGPRWVLGFEADIQGSGERGSSTLTDPFSGTVCTTESLNIRTGVVSCQASAPLGGTAVTSYAARIDWFGTVRGRIGLLINDGLLLYGTGGLAYGHVSVSSNVNISATAPSIAESFGPSANGFSRSKTNRGFAAGGGLEGRFSAWLPPNWTWKLEYLYVDLGSVDSSTSFAAVAADPTVFSPLNGTVTTHTHFTDNIVRAGLNYQFH